MLAPIIVLYVITTIVTGSFECHCILCSSVLTVKYCIAQNFGKLVPKTFWSKNIGRLAALHSKLTKIKIAGG